MAHFHATIHAIAVLRFGRCRMYLFSYLAAKRNAILKLVPSDVTGVLNMDDDDIYLPWAVSASAHALKSHKYVEPSEALEWSGPGMFVFGERLALSRNYTYGNQDENGARAYGAQWSFRTEAIRAIGGYPEYEGIGEDGHIHCRLQSKYGPPGDTICKEYPLPFFIHSRSQSGGDHISEMGIGNAGYESFGRQKIIPVKKLTVEPVIEYEAFSIPDTINPRPW